MVTCDIQVWIKTVVDVTVCVENNSRLRAFK